jgi:hypothetical protein
MGQNQIAAAILHRLEEFPIFSIDYAALNADPSAKTLEESCVRVFGEARRKLPSVVYLPHIDAWWTTSSESLRFTLASLLQDQPSTTPLLFLATVDCQHAELPEELQHLFVEPRVCALPQDFDEVARRSFFDALAQEALRPLVLAELQSRALEPLPKAPFEPILDPAMAQLREEEDEQTMRDLRMVLRDIVLRLLNEKKYRIFERLPDADEEPEFYKVVTEPVCLEKILERIDDERYETLEGFMADVNQLVKNAVAYSEAGRLDNQHRLLSKAHHLADQVNSLLYRIDKELIAAAKKVSEKRAQDPVFQAKKAEKEKERKQKKRERKEREKQARTSARLAGQEVPLLELIEEPRKKKAKKDGGEGIEEADKENDKEAKDSTSQPMALEPISQDLPLTLPSPVVQKTSSTRSLPPPTIVVDRKRLASIMKRYTDVTASWSVEKLEALYTLLRRSIQKREADYDKAALLLDLEAILADLPDL